jgi:hypothetical protein
MTRTVIAAALAAAVLAGGTAYAAATDPQLASLEAEVRADEAAFEDLRESTDTRIRAITRPLFRQLLVPVTRCTDVAQCRALGANALDVLARPGPADSVAKEVHTLTRQLGSDAVQRFRRIAADLDALQG